MVGATAKGSGPRLPGPLLQYLIQDLLYTTVLASVMGFTHPARKLSKQRPPERLMSLGIWLPVILQFVTCALFQVRGSSGDPSGIKPKCWQLAQHACACAAHTLTLVMMRIKPDATAHRLSRPLHPHPRCPRPLLQLAALLMLTRQPFYTRFDPHPDGTNCFDRTQSNSTVCSQSYENSIVFLMSLGQFLIAAFVFNKGPPFRRPIYTNLWLLLGEGCAGRGAGSKMPASPTGRAVLVADCVNYLH